MANMNMREYYERRAESASRLAAGAASPGIRKIHQQLARQYEQLAAGEPAIPRRKLSVVTG